MKSLALIMQSGLSSWMSCSKINRHLLNAYQSLSEYKVELIGLEDQERNSYSVVKQLIHARPQVISFVDHRLSLLELFRFEELIESLRSSQATILIHIYGSFQVRLREFELLGQALYGLDVRFICGSQAQKRVLETFYPAGTCLETIPFALKASEFTFDQEQRLKRRLEFNYGPQDQVLLYLGRISSDKNVELAIHCAERARQSNPKLKFLIVGPIDDYSLPFDMKDQRYRGYQAAVFANYLDTKRDWVTWCPQIQEFEVASFLSAADGFISLSTQKGEDFGMAVAEALSSGLKTIITGWGGYHEFAHIGDTISCPVSLDLEIETEIVVNALGTVDSADRLAAHEKVEQQFGVNVYAGKLLNLLKRTPCALKALPFDTLTLTSQEVARRGYA